MDSTYAPVLEGASKYTEAAILHRTGLVDRIDAEVAARLDLLAPPQDGLYYLDEPTAYDVLKVVRAQPLEGIDALACRDAAAPEPRWMISSLAWSYYFAGEERPESCNDLRAYCD